MRSLLFILIFGCTCFAAKTQTVPSWKITDLEKYIQSSSSPLIVNFWATFCKPCLEEIPYFEETVKKYKREGVAVLLVSLDMKEQYPGAIAEMIAKRKFASKVVWLNETNADYFCPKIDSSWSGVLPSTLFVNNKNGYRKFFEEKVPEKQLEKEMDAMIAGNKE